MAADPDHVRVRPTRNCLRLAFVMAAMGLAAVNYQSNAAWGLVFLVLALGVVAAVHGRRNLDGLDARPLTPEPTFADQPIHAEVALVNRSGRPARAVGVSLGDAASTASVAAGSSATVAFDLPTRPRGRYRLEGLRLRSRFPLALVEASRAIAHGVDGIVYPRLAGSGLEAAVASGDGQSDAAGPHGEDFAGHRRPLPGEPQRHIDWKAVARGRPMLIKHFAGSGGEWWFDWTHTAGDDENRVSQLALWVVEAERCGWRYGLRLPGVSLQPANGAAHRHACLAALAVHPEPPADADL